jgi:hypothetical protein
MSNDYTIILAMLIISVVSILVIASDEHNAEQLLCNQKGGVYITSVHDIHAGKHTICIKNDAIIR